MTTYLGTAYGGWVEFKQYVALDCPSLSQAIIQRDSVCKQLMMINGAFIIVRSSSLYTTYLSIKVLPI